MNEHRSITAPLDAETLAKVEEVARARGMSGVAFAAEAIRVAAAEALDMDAFVAGGIASIERGEIYSQDDVEAWFAKRVAARRRG